MPLQKDAGRIRLSKSGKALEIHLTFRPFIEYRLYAPLKEVEAVIKKKKVEANLALLVHESREKYLS